MARAAEKVADKAKAIVAHQLEADPADIELRDGKWIVRGSPEKGMALADVAGAAYVPENLPDGMEPGLDETAFYDPENFVFPFGAHACVVDVDAETGKVEIVRYVAVDDCGPAINPMLIDGQVHGGIPAPPNFVFPFGAHACVVDVDGETGKIQVVRYVAVDDCGPPINPLLIDGQVHGGITHALGQALYEQVHYDEDGQLVTGSFVDYALPTAAELPSYETDRTETPSPVNSLGVKGVGEAGTIAGSATVTNAVIDALRPLGVTFLDMPLTPMRVWSAINEAKGGSQ